MSIALAKSGVTQIAVCCEMMDDNSGGSMTTDQVKKYAEKEGLQFLNGKEIIKAYKKFFERKKI